MNRAYSKNYKEAAAKSLKKNLGVDISSEDFEEACETVCDFQYEKNQIKLIRCRYEDGFEPNRGIEFACFWSPRRLKKE